MELSIDEEIYRKRYLKEANASLKETYRYIRLVNSRGKLSQSDLQMIKTSASKKAKFELKRRIDFGYVIDLSLLEVVLEQIEF